MWLMAFHLVIFLTVAVPLMDLTPNPLAANVVALLAAWLLGAPVRWFLRIVDHGRALRETERWGAPLPEWLRREIGPDQT